MSDDRLKEIQVAVTLGTICITILIVVWGVVLIKYLDEILMRLPK